MGASFKLRNHAQLAYTHVKMLCPPRCMRIFYPMLMKYWPKNANPPTDTK